MNIDELLSKMTIEEKVAQLCAVPIEWLLDENKDFSEEKAKLRLKNGIGQITRLAGGSGLTPEKAAKIGNKIQKFLRENTRLGIPALIHEECLSGYLAMGATSFPQAIGLASTWNPDLIQKMTSVIRQQMKAVGAHQGLAPVLDVARDPRWGRVEETFGEDQYLVASMGVAYVKGLQGDNLKEGIAATLKHFAGHSFSEGGRNTAPVHVGEREMKDVFLYPFEAAVKLANAQSVMNAYHDIDGIPCAASKELLTNILREQWGFNGIVVSDYNAIDMLRSYHYTAKDKSEAAKQALEAGLDIELPGIDCYGEPLINAVKSGLIPMEVLDTSVRRVLEEKEKLGIFECVYVDTSKVNGVFDTEDQRSLARDIARESIILLKNENGILPISKDIKSIAVIGPNADTFRNVYGDYAYTAHLNCSEPSVKTVTVLDGIRAKIGTSAEILYAKGCDLSDPSKDGFTEAVEAAKKAEVAVVVLGEKSGFAPDCMTGESKDRDELDLPGVQLDLLKAVYNTGKPVVLVLINGRPLAIEWAAKNIDAILEAWFPGEECGNAIADVLFGDYNPGGKLPVTIPQNSGQSILTYNIKQSSYHDYVYHKLKPVYPFGHGLSYTTFNYDNLSISPDDEGIIVSFDVKNTGNIEGDEVVQLYIRDVIASVVRPLKELKGFKRVHLKPGETKRVSIKLYEEQLAFTDKDYKLVVEPGTFEVMVGSSSDDIRLKGSFQLGGSKRYIERKRFFSDVTVY